MIRISQIKLRLKHTKEELEKEISRQLKLTHADFTYKIAKRSIDARKGEVKYVYTVLVSFKDKKLEKKLANGKLKNVSVVAEKTYQFQPMGDRNLSARPVIVGYGPAGMFCAYLLAKYGYRPIIIERGEKVDDRQKSIDSFFETNHLNPESNVLFGEGGAGTFSDGKLNTLVKDKFGRNDYILQTFVTYGADEKIIYDNKPHIGTDVLSQVVKNMREETIKNGGEFYFHSRMDNIEIVNESQKRIHITDTKSGETSVLETELLVLAIGHSARDTFEMLCNKGFIMEPKPFAMGVRIEHPREMIDKSQYGEHFKELPAANYKLTHRARNGRGVYTFCMCPGGYVVNSSSEQERICVNGMSYSGRNGVNSNSAIIVTVSPEDFGSDSVLAGVEFQRNLEHRAYLLGESKVPYQLYGDFKQNTKTTTLGEVNPMIKGQHTMANVREIFPDYISEAVIDGVEAFSTKIKGYNRSDAIVSGIEARTSSPVRIVRNDTFESNISGIYPCGEGAGYAGGITSAAMDGMKIAEMIVAKYAPLTD